ncbi:MAG: YiiX family permuted papain-like enzyme [Myxococcota bacterium]|nr:YiiX family permuted papain-like enzyme [Myxococcota bacterium]
MTLLHALISFALAATPTEGDLIFHTSRSTQSEAIQLATASPYSHVGIITFQNGEPMVYEAVQTVKTTPLPEWIARGEGGKYRLMRTVEPLDNRQLESMKTIGQKHQQKRYDIRFEWSDEKMYCSELVWKIYKEGAGIQLSKPRTMDSYHIGNPEVRRTIEARWGASVNWKENMVAPSDLAESPLLKVVSDTTGRQ